MRGVQFFLCFKVVSHFVCFLLFICLVSDNDWLVKKTEQLQLGLRMIVATELAYFGASLMCLLLSAFRNHIQLILKSSYFQGSDFKLGNTSSNSTTMFRF